MNIRVGLLAVLEHLSDKDHPITFTFKGIPSLFTPTHLSKVLYEQKITVDSDLNVHNSSRLSHFGRTTLKGQYVAVHN